MMGASSSAQAWSQCSYNSQNQIDNNLSGANPGFCNADPLQRKVNAYKIGLCTELPYHNNYEQVCDLIYDSPTPIELVAEKGTSKSIDGIGDITLIEGKSYTHSVLLISNTTYVKTLLEFDSPKLGKTGSGNHCWSVGVNISTTDMSTRSGFSADCGTLSQSDPQYNTETSAYFTSAVNPNVPAMERNFPTYNGGWTNELMSNDVDKATFDSETPTWNDSTNTSYWLAGRPINPSVEVKPSTTNLDLRFEVSWGSLIGYSGVQSHNGDNWDSACAATPCIGDMRIAGFDFTVVLN